MINAILIENDLFYKTSIINTLDEMGVTILGIAENIRSALELLNSSNPHIIITETMLGKEPVFEIFNTQPHYCNIPTLFLTSSKSESDFKHAKRVVKYLYFIKPIHKMTLKSAVESLCGKVVHINTTLSQNSLSFKGKFNEKISLPFDKIIYINQVQHYCTIHTQAQKFVLKKSLTSILKLLDQKFMQTHRSHCVNVDFIKNFGHGLDNIKINNNEIPIGFTYKNAIKKLIAEKFSVK
jgi:DNA-binding LytR/AlgR family response regulator